MNSDNLNNNLRPYTHGITERDGQVATITLYNGAPVVTSTPTKNINFNSEGSREMVAPLQAKVNNSTTQDQVQSTSPLAPILNKAEDGGLYFGIFNNFSLIEVSEAKESITKLHQNFGQSWNLFFFGDSPSVYSFRGVFLDTWEYPYYQEFLTMYDRFLKGSKCVEHGYKMKIAYDNKIVGGYLLNIRTVVSADAPHTKTFAFTVIVTDENFMRTNAVVDGSNFTGKGGFNQMNNSHRMVSGQNLIGG